MKMAMEGPLQSRLMKGFSRRVVCGKELRLARDCRALFPRFKDSLLGFIVRKAAMATQAWQCGEEESIAACVSEGELALTND
jgi:hypothetical protein